jgi:hypothetical protein
MRRQTSMKIERWGDRRIAKEKRSEEYLQEKYGSERVICRKVNETHNVILTLLHWCI